MPCQSDEEEPPAPPPHGFSTPTKPNSNDGSGHNGSDAENSDAESAADVEEEFEEDAEIDDQIYTEMKKFMQ